MFIQRLRNVNDDVYSKKEVCQFENLFPINQYAQTYNVPFLRMCILK